MSAYDDGEAVEEQRTVRPYTVTGGRTRPRSSELPLEALVSAALGAERIGALTAERRRIVELTAERILSVAELSAYLLVPLGVTRVLVGDLVAEGAVSVSGQPAQAPVPATDLNVLESVLHGISAL